MEKKAVYSMTEGSPAKLLLKFTIPMLIGNLFQQFYNMVDSIVVGRFVGSNALAAVGATGSLNFLFFAMSFGHRGRRGRSWSRSISGRSGWIWWRRASSTACICWRQSLP